MNTKNTIKTLSLFTTMSLALFSCKKDEVEEPVVPPVVEYSDTSYQYQFHNGQTVEAAPYSGAHPSSFSATMSLQELVDNKTTITVTLANTIDGEVYRIHAHDAADPATTPNGTPYNETPNNAVFTQMVTGNGGTVTATQEVDMVYADIISTYNGFFVIHDPLQNLSTSDISTYLVVGSFARAQAATNYASTTFNYDFNTGQVSPTFAYNGAHASTLSGALTIDELADGGSRVSVRLNNTIDTEVYMTHAHDQADPASTPNGTPYNETPNAGLCQFMITGNGGTAYNAQLSTLSHANITSTYEGFFVVHDPLQAVSTTDPTTYVLLGSFAR